MKKPILATAASDHVLMVWHYTTHPGQLTLQVVKSLQDTIQAVAIHPSGFYLVIAHLDRIKVYAIYTDDIVPSPFSNREILVRGCSEIQFSNGGHLFAINDDDGTIHVYKFW